jgi:hypothetical protein
LVISPLRAPHCAFCAFGCGLLFGLRSFLFSSLVPLLAGCFSFIYLFTRPQVFIVDIGAPDFISRDKIWMAHHHFPKIHYQKLSPTPAAPHSTHSKPRNSPLVSPPHWGVLVYVTPLTVSSVIKANASTAYFNRLFSCQRK